MKKETTVDFLKTLQRTMHQREAVTTDFDGQKEKLFSEVKKLNKDCYAQLLGLPCSFNHSMKIGQRQVRLVCSNDEAYLGSAYSAIEKLLSILKDDVNVFGFTMKKLDRSKTLNPRKLAMISEEFVHLLFVDFASYQKSLVALLRQIGPLLEAFLLRPECSLYSAIFDEEKMLNRLLQEYMWTRENRAYLQLVFRPILSQMENLEDYVARLQLQKTLHSESSTREEDFLAIEKESHSALYGNQNATSSPISEMDMYTSVSSLNNNFDLKHDDQLSTKELILIVDEILKSIIKNLVNMPLSIKLLCKLLEKSLQKTQNEFSLRKLIMDILYKKYWLHALMNPRENGIYQFVGNNPKLVLHLSRICELLQRVLYGRDIKQEIISHMYIVQNDKKVEDYITRLLSSVSSEETVSTVHKSNVNLRSSCLSIEIQTNSSSLYDIYKDNIEELKTINDVFVKFVNRITFCIRNQQANMGHGNFFEPTEDTFKTTYTETLSPEEFAKSRHFLVLQELSLTKKSEEKFVPEPWQQCLYHLLTKITLTDIDMEKEDSDSKNNPLKCRLKRILKQPSYFYVEKDQEIRVKFLVHYLLDYFEKVEGEDSKTLLEEMCSIYLANVEKSFKLKKDLEDEIKFLITNLSRKATALEEERLRYEQFHYGWMLSSTLINNIPFEIDISTGSPQRAGGRSPSSVNQAPKFLP